jgi:hypothetical protein
VNVPPEPLQSIPYDDLPEGHADWYTGGEAGENPESTAFDHLPLDSPIREVRQLIGDYRALLFWAYVDREGKRNDRHWRRQVYLPKKARREHALTHAVGWEAAKQISQYFGGITIDLPNINFSSREAARRYAFILRDRGLSTAEIAQEISLDRPIDVSTVKKWLQTPED